MVNLWITIRGFSFASAWLELYKQSKKRAYNGQKLSEKIFTIYIGSCKLYYFTYIYIIISIHY